MGLSMDQVNSGMLDASNLVNQSMTMWDRIQQSLRPTTPTIAPTVSAPAVADRAVVQKPTAPATGLSAIPLWAWGIGIGLLIWRLS
jgi:hypothetical protein